MKKSIRFLIILALGLGIYLMYRNSKVQSQQQQVSTGSISQTAPDGSGITKNIVEKAVQQLTGKNKPTGEDLKEVEHMLNQVIDENK